MLLLFKVVQRINSIIKRAVRSSRRDWCVKAKAPSATYPLPSVTDRPFPIPAYFLLRVMEGRVGEGVAPACSVQKLRGAFQFRCLSLVEFKRKLGEVVWPKPRFCDLESTSSGNSGLNTGVIWAGPKGDDGGVAVHDLLHGHNGSPNSIKLLSLLPPWPSPA